MMVSGDSLLPLGISRAVFGADRTAFGVGWDVSPPNARLGRAIRARLNMLILLAGAAGMASRGKPTIQSAYRHEAESLLLRINCVSSTSAARTAACHVLRSTASNVFSTIAITVFMIISPFSGGYAGVPECRCWLIQLSRPSAES